MCSSALRVFVILFSSSLSFSFLSFFSATIYYFIFNSFSFLTKYVYSLDFGACVCASWSEKWHQLNAMSWNLTSSHQVNSRKRKRERETGKIYGERMSLLMMHSYVPMQSANANFPLFICSVAMEHWVWVAISFCASHTYHNITKHNLCIFTTAKHSNWLKWNPLRLWPMYLFVRRTAHLIQPQIKRIDDTFYHFSFSRSLRNALCASEQSQIDRLAMNEVHWN